MTSDGYLQNSTCTVQRRCISQMACDIISKAMTSSCLRNRKLPVQYQCQEIRDELTVEGVRNRPIPASVNPRWIGVRAIIGKGEAI